MAGRTEEDAPARPESTRRPFPVALTSVGVLGVLVVVGAVFSGPLTFTGPRLTIPGFESTPPARSAPVQSPPPSVRPSPEAAAKGTPPNLTWLVILIACVIAALIIALILRWYLANRHDRVESVAAPLDEILDLQAVPDDPSVETGSPYLRRGLLRAIDVLDGDRTPTDAIVAAWLGLQEAAEDAGFQRQSAETPTEFTGRILRLVPVDQAPLDTLRRLYLAVRFGDATASTADVARARAALATLATQWESTEAAPPAPPTPSGEPGSGGA